LFLFFLPFPLSAQEPCETKYPDDGQCKAACEEGESHDDTVGLCSTGKCCHSYAEALDITLQVPLFGYTKAQNIIEYIATIYNAALYIVVPIIIVVLIFSGAFWVLAGGDSELISKAKSWIINAFIGLGIVLFSYIILSFLGLTELTLLKVEEIEPLPHEDLKLYTWEMAQELGAGTDYESVGGQCFPVPRDSFLSVSWNFKAPRAGGNRYHAGVDIYTKPPANVIAIADGTVTAISRQFYRCGAPKCRSWAVAGMTGKVMINHGSFTVNYAEIDANKIAPEIVVGAKVSAGQFLGKATHCCMLHFEIYEGNVSQSKVWLSGKPKPKGLVDPTNTLRELEKKQCSMTR